VATQNPLTVGRVRRWKRRLRLQELGYRNYREYLRSPHWKAKRLEYAGSEQPQDCMCGETEGLQLHHLTYERIGAEEVTDLTPLCATCHAMVHTLEARGEIGLDFTGFVNEERAKRRKAEVEVALYERRMGLLQDVAFVEDGRRTFRELGRRYKPFKLTSHRIAKELEKFETKLETLGDFRLYPS
jgi:hypothetical protein